MTIRAGIGGWSYEGWRDGVFYPADLPQRRELEYAARHVRTIEINATFYRLQKPESFRKWHDEVPDDFIFALKGSRYVSNRKLLAEAEEGVGNFLKQGLVELGPKLGPICWQLATTKRFDPDDISAFFDLLPAQHEGVALRHAIEVGHESFACADFVELARKAGVAVVWSDHPERTPIADRSAGFAYLRLQGMEAGCPTGYPPAELDRIRRICESWAGGHAPQGLSHYGDRGDSRGEGGDVFAFMINGAKERAPAAAMALADMLKGSE
ncbi:uncharacterized protein YecE (DUF72 family) [Altererythrobacter atlanticus]|uniref:Uncharacterized protein n=1 Tax=Croceibacterium atlanticum TaxID=1267766 RepID=A0A0F7KWN0_9SPHN|nr:DUF72 domain-containing protein [Croceibacterium atlanticum]AKH44069.1 hypothetical protein WYH_03049 [Croceibacterium atlanticum]MBB5732378.1 uncharacterized protein YecE (DUF72 family) [Croceibacterium atlanticum]